MRSFIALAALVAVAPMARAASPAELFGPDLAGFPPFVRSRAAEIRFQGPDNDESEAAPRWESGKGASESIAPGAAAPLDAKKQAVAKNSAGMPTGANEDDASQDDPDLLGPDDEGPARPRFRRLFACFGPVQHGRYRDVGNPLERESWRNRPLNVGVFVGSLAADDLIKNRIVVGTAFFPGVRLGWDYSHFGGLETRLGVTKIALGYPQNPTVIGDVDFLLWDASWLYYPWGDTQWRPFFTVGLGMVDMKFINDQGLRDHDTVFGMPLGFGVKYRWDAQLAFRFDIMDNVAFAAGNGLDDMNHFSFTGGLEWHFGGGARRSYWPWNAAREMW